MKILVVGCGSIGRRHIRLLKEMGVTVAGQDLLCLDVAMTAKLGDDVPIYAFLSGAIDHFEPDGVIIATPTHLHADHAVATLSKGIPALVEKPMAHCMEGAYCIQAAGEVNLETVEPRLTPLLLGYPLRFHPGLRKLKGLIDTGTIGTVRHVTVCCSSYLPGWRPGFDYRQGYAAFKDQGGGVLLDMSHELDYARWLFGEPVSVMAQLQNTGALEIETEDVADLLIRFESGIQVNIHMDYLSRTPSRYCSVVGDLATANWCFDTDFVRLRDGIAQANPVVPDDLYRAELTHFLACIRGEETPLVTGEDGVRVLRLVEAAKRSSVEGRVVHL